MGISLFDSRTALEPLRPRIDEAIGGVVDSGTFILGPNVEAFEEEFASALGSPHAVGVANGTEAITIALRALGVGAGDEVVVPSFTYFASAEAIPALGAVPVFCDVDPETFVSTPEQVRAAMTPRTKAVVAVHLFGNVAPVGEIEALGVPVVEDTAQAAGSTGPDGRPGALGTIATHSFYPSKNLGAFGDGGAITTADSALAERVRMLRFHGSRDKVVYEEAAYNSRLDEIQAAVLRVLLPELEGWAAGRRAAGERYAAELEGVAGLPRATPGSSPAWHLFVIRTPEPDALAEGLAGRGIEARGYYRTPVHLQPAMACWNGADADLPGTAEAARTHLALPISATITDAQVQEVAGAVRELLG